MMSGRDFALLSSKISQVKPKKEDSVAVWQMYSECVNAVASACGESNLARFKKGQFLKQCFGTIPYEPNSSHTRNPSYTPGTFNKRR